MVRLLELCVEVALASGFFFMEHPEDPYVKPYPSIWATDLWRDVSRVTRAKCVSFDQGR